MDQYVCILYYTYKYKIFFFNGIKLSNIIKTVDQRSSGKGIVVHIILYDIKILSFPEGRDVLRK